jgi:Holliday junction resolvase RusA-like endonuclease
MSSPRIPLSVSFWVPGVPVPWKRPQGGKTSRRFNDPAQTEWEHTIRLYAQKAMAAAKQKCTSAPIVLRAEFAFPMAKNWILKGGELSAAAKKYEWRGMLYHTKDPDASNLLKAVEDALIGVCYDDDNQIHAYDKPQKVFDHTPGVRIEVHTP